MLIQVLLIGLVTFIAAIDQFNLLESLHQPIVTGVVVGIILGNPALGLKVGGLYQLIQIGSVPIGGAQPPNVVIGGIMATIFAIQLNIEPTAAVGLAIPFAVLGQLFVTLIFTVMSPLMGISDKFAEEANPRGIDLVNYGAMAALGLAFAVVVMIAFVGGEALGTKIKEFFDTYKWLSALFGTFGGMLRFVGFAILMRIMLAKDLWVFYFAGFASATILGQLPALADSTLLLLAMFGLAIAVFDYYVNTKIKHAAGSAVLGGDEDGI